MKPARPTASARTLLALALPLATLPGCGSSPDPVQASGGEAAAVAAATAPGPVPILRGTSDANGAPRAYTLVLIEDAGSLPGPIADLLRPDFGSESVVFLGMGEQAGGGFGARITGVERVGDELVVSADFQRPEGEPAGGATTPWSAVVIPRQGGLSMPLLSNF